MIGRNVIRKNLWVWNQLIPESRNRLGQREIDSLIRRGYRGMIQAKRRSLELGDRDRCEAITDLIYSVYRYDTGRL